mmetsp:Transcript_8736/g.23694  ORF Transcript_8736/g.23694 Transcript_8736/m.23694 type:complete len:205 (+) Transcript_8736:143-757(+)
MLQARRLMVRVPGQLPSGRQLAVLQELQELQDRQDRALRRGRSGGLGAQEPRRPRRDGPSRQGLLRWQGGEVRPLDLLFLADAALGERGQADPLAVGKGRGHLPVQRLDGAEQRERGAEPRYPNQDPHGRHGRLPQVLLRRRVPHGAELRDLLPRLEEGVRDRALPAVRLDGEGRPGRGLAPAAAPAAYGEEESLRFAVPQQLL